jgi:filamentous hemagglutinin family protein
MRNFWAMGQLGIIQVVVVGLASVISPALAQITPDTSLAGETSIVTSTTINGLPSDQIEGGATRGSNLFHSFLDFNVNAGQGAYFNTPTGIANIFSRVTGSNASNLQGTLGVLGNANLFFLNPNGIIFGPNVSLDVRGSFLATTANALQFGDQGLFEATNPNTPPLLTVNPSALLFNQVSAQPIVSQAQLQVPVSRSLLLVGGDVTLNGGQLQAPSGQIELGGVSGPGRITLTNQNGSYSIDVDSLTPRSDVVITGGAIVNVAGNNSGGIHLQGRNLSMDQGSSLLLTALPEFRPTNSSIGTIELNASNQVTLDTGALIVSAKPTGSSARGGEITVQADSLIMRNAASINTATDGSANGGNIAITANQVRMVNNAGIQSSTTGSGDGGNILVNATNSVEQIGTFSSFESNTRILSITEGTGKAGDLTINTQRLQLDNAALAGSTSLAAGQSGNLTLNATESIVARGVAPITGTPSQFAALFGGFATATFGTGDAGMIQINTQQFRLEDGATAATTTFGLGQGGDVIINASDSVTIVGGSDGQLIGDLVTFVGGLVTATLTGTSAAGNMTINTGQLNVEDGGVISTTTFGAGQGGDLTINADSITVANPSPTGRAYSVVTTASFGEGDAGDMNLNTSQLTVLNGGVISTTAFSGGQGGNLTINATESVVVSGVSPIPILENLVFPGGLVTGTTGNGDAGDLIINTGQLLINEQASVGTATYGLGQGGSLMINANVVNLSTNGLLSTQSQGSSDAGMIKISANSLNLNQGNLVATATEAGGGDIEIAAQNVFLTNNSLISTSVSDSTGGGGNITIQSDSFVALENSDLLATAVLGPGGNITIVAQEFLADIFANAGPTPPGITDFETLRTNGRVDISASSDRNVSGQIQVPDLRVLERSLQDLSISLISPEQIVAGSCLAPQRSNGDSRFAVTGAGGVALTPYESMPLEFTAMNGEPQQTSTQQSNSHHQTRPDQFPPTLSSIAEPWQLGDPIREANGLVVTPDGRQVLSRLEEPEPAVKPVSDLICN